MELPQARPHGPPPLDHDLAVARLRRVAGACAVLAGLTAVAAGGAAGGWFLVRDDQPNEASSVSNLSVTSTTETPTPPEPSTSVPTSEPSSTTAVESTSTTLASTTTTRSATTIEPCPAPGPSLFLQTQTASGEYMSGQTLVTFVIRIRNSAPAPLEVSWIDVGDEVLNYERFTTPTTVGSGQEVVVRRSSVWFTKEPLTGRPRPQPQWRIRFVVWSWTHPAHARCPLPAAAY